MSTQYPPPVYYTPKPRRPLSVMDVGILMIIFLLCVGCILFFAVYMAMGGNLSTTPPTCAVNEYGSPIIIDGCATQVYGAQALVETLPTATPLPPLVEPSPLPPLPPTAIPPTATPVCFVRTDLPAYTVRAGDTVFSIAGATGSTIDEIRVWNCMADVNRISVGQLLYVRVLPSALTAAFAPSGMSLIGSNLYGANIRVCNDDKVAIQFANNTTNAARYLWSFGDNTTSTEVNPSHTYQINRSGMTSFNVTLTAYSWDNVLYSTTATLMFTPHCP